MVRVPGFIVAGVHSGLKKGDALDLALIVGDGPCTAAGVFTTNLVKAAPVILDIDHLNANADRIRAVVINSGCANACTGQQGLDNALATAALVADKIGCRAEEILVLSTGVIGVQLAMDKIRSGIERAAAALGNDWDAAARAIMTTDTRPKLENVEFKGEDGRVYAVTGIAKGAGMIAPNMATMLAVIVTDFPLDVSQAQTILKKSADRSFNRIVVDGDMSTNDTVLLLANRPESNVVSDADLRAFEQACCEVCTQLARQIVRDGEGATKFITVNITGASDDAAARTIGMAVATSPLVKTAFYGNDANWGRVVAAAGRAGVPVNPDRMGLWITPGQNEQVTSQSLQLFWGGMPAEYAEADAATIMQSSEISLLLECGKGEGQAVVWTCDLSHDYVSINGSYRS